MTRPAWLDPSELRIGLGCMRMSPDEGAETIVAAADAGITVFDTARAYGENERLLADALRSCGCETTGRVVTKGGMTRAGGGWVPDGRAKAILADCEASLAALDGLEIDLYLLHAPDPRRSWATSVRAFARLVDEGLVKRVGLSNVNRLQLDEALELAPVSAVQVALSVFDHNALRGGVVERCAEAGVAVMAHSPLGGPRRAGRLARFDALVEIANAREVSPAEVALAWLLALSPGVVAIPGARRPETARSAARAASIELDEAELEALGGTRPDRTPRRRPADDAEVVLVMGIPGAGKTRVAADYVERGYVRLNRDERGGSLRQLADALEEELESGTRRIVVDSTYLTRAARSYVIDAARRHAVAARCIWLDTPLAQAQVNLVERLLERLGSLPTPEEIRALSRRSDGVMAPTSQMRALRELEPPSADEGWADIEQLPFSRAASPDAAATGVFVGAVALEQPGWKDALERADPTAPHLVFDWRPEADVGVLAPLAAELTAQITGPVETALCPHPGGPPTCWCRPPLPGLVLAFAHAHNIDPSRSTLIGTSAAHRTLAATLGADYVEAQ